MASAPQSNLPLFYKDLMPLNSRDHARYRSKGSDRAEWLVGTHAIPLTVDEFVQAQRDFPIVFSAGDNPLPLALMGLNEGVNTFVDDQGKLADPVYLPAYIRRYPFLLAKIKPDSDELSLCFDPTTDTLGEFDEGQELFDAEGQASEATKRILEFCEQFEQAGQRTKAFFDELKKQDLLMDGEIAITAQQNGEEKTFTYRGFQMIDQQKLPNVPAETLAEWTKSGMMALIFAHLFSLDLMRTIFARQQQQGKGPLAANSAVGDPTTSETVQ